jgi:hypothetical protein
MALALRMPLFIVIVALGTSLPQLQPTALAAGLDAEGKATSRRQRGSTSRDCTRKRQSYLPSLLWTMRR